MCHVSTAPVARPTAFGPRQYSVYTAGVTRVAPAVTRAPNFCAAQKCFRQATASKFPAACKRVLNASVSRLHRVLFTFNGVCFTGTIFWT